MSYLSGLQQPLNSCDSMSVPGIHRIRPLNLHYLVYLAQIQELLVRGEEEDALIDKMLDMSFEDEGIEDSTAVEMYEMLGGM